MTLGISGRFSECFIVQKACVYSWDITFIFQAKEPKAIMRIETLNATFQPAKIGNPCGLQITYLRDNSTRNIFVYHEDSKVSGSSNSFACAREWLYICLAFLQSNTVYQQTTVQPLSLSRSDCEMFQCITSHNHASAFIQTRIIQRGTSLHFISSSEVHL